MNRAKDQATKRLEATKRDIRAIQTIVEKMGVSFNEAEVVMLNLRKIVKPEWKSKRK